jgi:hypothetical protein
MTVLDLNPNRVVFTGKKRPNDILKDVSTNTNQRDEEKLNVVIMMSNPCNFKRRVQLATEFIQRAENYPGMTLYVAELVYGDNDYQITNADNPHHLQLRTDSPLWHKETVIRVAIDKLLPDDWTKVAWVDADLDFDNIHWAQDTVKLLDYYDIVQCFSHCIDMDINEDPMNIWQGAGFQYCHKMKRGLKMNYWHCGYAWACTRKFYEQMGGLYDVSILGSGDHNMMTAWLGSPDSIPGTCHPDYKKTIEAYTRQVKGASIGYTPGVIRHFFHGSKVNRKYRERWEILVRYQYNPVEHTKRDDNGLLIASDTCPKGLLEDIYQYFLERNEDECL